MNIKQLNEAISKAMREALEPEIEEKIDSFMKTYGELEFYADYNDTLSKQAIAKICEDPKSILDMFYDYIDQFNWWDEEHEIYDDVFDQLPLDPEFKEENEEEIKDYLLDNYPINIPYEHFNEKTGWDVYLKNDYQDTLFEVVRTGKAKFSTHLTHDGLKQLIKLQGYSVEEFEEYWTEKKEGNKFFDSVIKEIEDATYEYGNDVVFLISKPILDMGSLIVDNGELEIKANITCGLTNRHNGSGSDLSIELEKDMKIPVSQLDIQQKDAYNYNVDEINGLVAGAWK